MKWRAYRAEICFHSGFSSCVEYLLIFAKEKIRCGIKDQVRCRRFRELSGLGISKAVGQALRPYSLAEYSAEIVRP